MEHYSYDESLELLVGDLSFDNRTRSGEFTIASWHKRNRVHFAWFKRPELEVVLPNSYQKSSQYTDMFRKRELYKNDN
jgi:hypothetical protein